MDYYVKEMSDKSAKLIAIDGYELAIFASADEAVLACQQGCLVEPLFVERHYDFLQAGAFACGSDWQPCIH